MGTRRYLRIVSSFCHKVLTFCLMIFGVLIISNRYAYSNSDCTSGPCVDDTKFIVDAGMYNSSTDDFDILILREGFSSIPENLDTLIGLPPSGIAGNPASFNDPIFGTRDYFQSILVRIFDSGAGDYVAVNTLKGKITFNGPVNIVGIATSFQPEGRDAWQQLHDSDHVFHDSSRHPYTAARFNPLDPGYDPLYLDKLAGDAEGDYAGGEAAFDKTLFASCAVPPCPIWRDLEISGEGTDIITIFGNTVTFELQTKAGADDFRIILDYGASFSPGVSFNVELEPDSELGIQVGDVDYGEAVKVLNIPLTSDPSLLQPVSRMAFPDDQYFTHTKGRDVVVFNGGDDDNNTIAYFVVDPVLVSDNFYIYLYDGDNDAIKSASVGKDDVNAELYRSNNTAGDSIFEYRVYGGSGASNPDDPVNVTAAGLDVPVGNPTDIGELCTATNFAGIEATCKWDDYAGTLIDINPLSGVDFRGANPKTLRTDLDGPDGTGILKDQAFMIIPVSIITTPGDTNGLDGVPGTGDTFEGFHIYKLVVDGSLGSKSGTGLAKDWNRFQVEVSRDPQNPDLDTGVQVFGYELVFAGRPYAFKKTTETLIKVPDISDNALDIQTMDLDESRGGTLPPWNTTALLKVPLTPIVCNDGTPLETTGLICDEPNTFESGNQVFDTTSPFIWASLNQPERTAPFPSSSDSLTCDVFTTLAGSTCYDTTGNENAQWLLTIDPDIQTNPYALRACQGVLGGGICERLALLPAPFNQKPTCVLSVTPDPQTAGLNVTLNGSQSNDLDGSIVSYTFNFGDGSLDYTETVSSAPDGTFDGITTHSYSTAGTYPVTLTVEDDIGLQSQCAYTVTIISANTPPNCALTCDKMTTVVGDPVTCDASLSNDPDIGGSIVNYTFNFGDGTGDINNGLGPVAVHPYSQVGAYAVTATVTDNGSPALSDQCTFNIDVLEPTLCTSGIQVLGLRTAFPLSYVQDGDTFSIVTEVDNAKNNKNYIQIGLRAVTCTRTGLTISCGLFGTPGPGVYFTNIYISGSNLVVEFRVDGTNYVPKTGNSFKNKLPPDTRFFVTLGSQSSGYFTNDEVIHTSCSQPIDSCPPNTPPNACIFGEFQIIYLDPA